LLPTRINGTGLRVCAVCGAPVLASRICSALPWSAVMRRMYLMRAVSIVQDTL
jgi:hypothetical protein